MMLILTIIGAGVIAAMLTAAVAVALIVGKIVVHHLARRSSHE
jgi:hypothetical protein